jgi:hypothetical protein
MESVGERVIRIGGDRMRRIEEERVRGLCNS